MCMCVCLFTYMIHVFIYWFLNICKWGGSKFGWGWALPVFLVGGGAPAQKEPGSSCEGPASSNHNKTWSPTPIRNLHAQEGVLGIADRAAGGPRRGRTKLARPFQYPSSSPPFQTLKVFLSGCWGNFSGLRIHIESTCPRGGRKWPKVRVPLLCASPFCGSPFVGQWPIENQPKRLKPQGSLPLDCRDPCRNLHAQEGVLWFVVV